MTEDFAPSWTCPNCKVEKFDSQQSLVRHALACKQGRLDKDK